MCMLLSSRKARKRGAFLSLAPPGRALEEDTFGVVWWKDKGLGTYSVLKMIEKNRDFVL